MDEIKGRLIEIFERCSLIEDISLGFEENFKLIEDASGEMDSFAYMSTLIEIESEFGIEIPNEYMAGNLFNSMDALCELIFELKKFRHVENITNISTMP